MKKIIALFLVFLTAFSCAGCGTSAGGNPEVSGNAGILNAPLISEDTQMYLPGAVVKTGFGEIQIIDAAFCAKAQLYYTKSSTRHKSTINGKTTETYSETIHPGYLQPQEGHLVFALRTVMTNTTDEDLSLRDLKLTARFEKNASVYFSRGGNFEISDEAYSTLPAGASAEIMLAAMIPLETYHGSTEFLFETDADALGFEYSAVNVYMTMGYQEDDNQPASVDEVLNLAQSIAFVPHTETTATEETVPEETDPPMELTAGMNQKNNGENAAEGRAFYIENVQVGFMDQLPNRILTDRSFKYYAEDLVLNDSQVYLVVKFTAKILTEQTVDLADIGDDFMVQAKYNKKYTYDTNSDLAAIYEDDSNLKLVRKRSTSGNEIAIAPLASENVTVYIPCAAEVAENTDKPLVVTFISKYAGNETLEFTIR